MASNLRIKTNEGDFAILDEFYKSLIFQEIMDMGFSRNERDVLLVLFRKTLHFGKATDRLSIHHFSKLVGISENTLRATLKSLESKSLIQVEKSKGGKTKESTKYNQFRLGNGLVYSVFDKWKEIKDEQGIEIKYADV